jgi:hypothetical protein
MGLMGDCDGMALIVLSEVLDATNGFANGFLGFPGKKVSFTMGKGNSRVAFRGENGISMRLHVFT